MTIRSLAISLAVLAFASLGPVDIGLARTSHHAKPRHVAGMTFAPHRHYGSADRWPYVDVGRSYPYGGPLYTTCDRINADRMLVGTCR